jgi:hypothetical protein
MIIVSLQKTSLGIKRSIEVQYFRNKIFELKAKENHVQYSTVQYWVERQR